jgi:hypothetical protein
MAKASAGNQEGNKNVTDEEKNVRKHRIEDRSAT